MGGGTSSALEDTLFVLGADGGNVRTSDLESIGMGGLWVESRGVNLSVRGVCAFS